jgi:hypothetical protein
MKWYSAHVVLYVKFKRGAQRTYPVYEVVYLIGARFEGAALKKARAFGKRLEGGDFLWDGRPSTWVLAGIRKLNPVAYKGYSKRLEPLASGDELTFETLRVATRRQLRAFVSGRPVRVLYED